MVEGIVVPPCPLLPDPLPPGPPVAGAGVVVVVLVGEEANADFPRSSANKSPVMGRRVEANNAIGRAFCRGTPAAFSAMADNTNVLVLIGISFVLPPS